MDVASLASSNVPLLAAIGLGLLCSVSPCTMATNVAALAYVGRKASHRGYALATAALYTLGRMFSYTLIGVLIVLVGLEVNALSRFLQGAGAQFLGPFLIVVGILLLVLTACRRLPGEAGCSDWGRSSATWACSGASRLARSLPWLSVPTAACCSSRC